MQPSKTAKYHLGGNQKRSGREKNASNEFAYLSGIPFKNQHVPLDRRQRRAREFVERVYSMSKRLGDGLMIQTRVKWIDTLGTKANLHGYGKSPKLMAHVPGTAVSPASISSSIHCAARQLGKPVWIQARELAGCVALYVSRRTNKTRRAGMKGNGR